MFTQGCLRINEYYRNLFCVYYPFLLQYSHGAGFETLGLRRGISIASSGVYSMSSRGSSLEQSSFETDCGSFDFSEMKQSQNLPVEDKDVN